MKRTTKDKTTS